MVALPNHLHAPVTVELLRAGVHVLVEKPMGLSTAECDAMIEAAAAGGARLTVGLQFRFFDATGLVRDLLAGGLLGRLESFELRLGVVSAGRSPPTSCCVARRRAAACWWTTACTCSTCCCLARASGPRSGTGTTPTAAWSPTASWTWRSPPASPAGSRSAARATCATPASSSASAARLEVGVWDPDPPIRPPDGGAEVALSGRRPAGRRARARLPRRLRGGSSTIWPGRARGAANRSSPERRGGGRSP